MNWPLEIFNLSCQISSLEPPVGIFPSKRYPSQPPVRLFPAQYQLFNYYSSQPQAICDWQDMLDVFRVFSSRLIEFIIHSVMNYMSASNTQSQSVAGKLRTLDCTGLPTDGRLTSYLYQMPLLRESATQKWKHLDIR